MYLSEAEAFDADLEDFLECLAFDEEGYPLLFNADTHLYEYVEDPETFALLESLDDEGVLDESFMKIAQTAGKVLSNTIKKPSLGNAVTGASRIMKRTGIAAQKTMRQPGVQKTLRGAKRGMRRAGIAAQRAVRKPGVQNAIRGVKRGVKKLGLNAHRLAAGKTKSPLVNSAVRKVTGAVSTGAAKIGGAVKNNSTLQSGMNKVKKTVKTVKDTAARAKNTQFHH